VTQGQRYLCSRLTLFGTLDNIIDLGGPSLSFDDPYTWIDRRDHVTICKPINGTDEPYLEFARVVRTL